MQRLIFATHPMAALPCRFWQGLCLFSHGEYPDNAGHRHAVARCGMGLAGPAFWPVSMAVNAEEQGGVAGVASGALGVHDWAAAGSFTRFNPIYPIGFPFSLYRR
ncbi:MAG: hypothetical protein CM15mP120_15380 [Pseudomonadota bacterium]|nr:MAG: hypothetical protein CM15mP120_15380 [Pseudomonadota bacterium]